MRPDDVLLLDVLLAARDAVEFLSDSTPEQFRQDRLRQMATAKAVEIVGESASRLSDEFRAKHPEVPWHQVVGMRHRLVHDYFGIDLEEVWRTVKQDLPNLISTIEEWGSATGGDL